MTLSADGRPQVTMVWVDADGDDVLFNTADGRKKPQNLRRDPRIIISVQDRNDPKPSRRSGYGGVFNHGDQAVCGSTWATSAGLGEQKGDIDKVARPSVSGEHGRPRVLLTGGHIGETGKAVDLKSTLPVYGKSTAFIPSTLGGCTRKNPAWARVQISDRP